MSIEEQLEDIRQEQERQGANVALCLNYLQVVAEELGLRAKVEHLNRKLDAALNNGAGHEQQ